MKKNLTLSVVFLVVILMLAACDSEKGQEEQNSGKNTADMNVSFKAPERVEAGQKLEYSVTIEKDGQPVRDADVIVHLEMADMDHGKNGFRGKMESPGIYKGQAVLPMGGDWIAYVNVKTDGIETTRQFDFKAEGDMMFPEEMKKAGLNEDGSIQNPDF
ncbi:FixH family protein [Aneurinibacillus migulanus]|uniref:FixH family protein n=1 Tax=Aneurinibacillus migulanus TaxID=47500 RepID=UPI002E1E883F|nr:FixH family protein [Aneurinibacillus migulanus]